MDNIIEKLLANPIVPVFYHADVTYAQQVLQAAYNGGVRVFELTNRGENAYEVFLALQTYAQAHCPDLTLGIGTIYNTIEAERFIDGGAAFIVQPVTTAAVGEVCERYGVPWIPGAMTPTEIYQATLYGAEIVKVFPGNVLTPGFIKALRGPMPHVKLLVTNGVEPSTDNLASWFDAGVNAVGIGSALFSGGTNLPEIENRFRELMGFIKNHIKSNINT
ncbi:MAG: bifunctional 4-hydroxy-2-oxoglutarate aldolase/2-dehydro-3-deoxy-phosphogluconate aldolase [Saprospiraceae bacterium]